MHICIYSLREKSSEVRHDVLSEIQEWGRFQEELKGLQQSVLSVLSVLPSQSETRHIRVSALFVNALLLLEVEHSGDVHWKFVKSQPIVKNSQTHATPIFRNEIPWCLCGHTLNTFLSRQ